MNVFIALNDDQEKMGTDQGQDQGYDLANIFLIMMTKGYCHSGQSYKFMKRAPKIVIDELVVSDSFCSGKLLASQDLQTF